MTEYKLFKEVCKRFPNNVITLQKSYGKYTKGKTKEYQLYIDKANLWKYDWSLPFKTIEGLVEHLNEVFEKNNIEKL